MKVQFSNTNLTMGTSPKIKNKAKNSNPVNFTGYFNINTSKNSAKELGCSYLDDIVLFLEKKLKIDIDYNQYATKGGSEWEMNFTVPNVHDNDIKQGLKEKGVDIYTHEADIEL